MTLTQERVEAPTLRSLYDPSGKYSETPDDVFYGTLAQLRPKAQLVGFGALHGCEISLADAIHAGLDAPAAMMAGVKESRASSIRDSLEEHTDRSVQRIANMTERFAIDEPRKSRFGGIVQPWVDSMPDGTCDRPVTAMRMLMLIEHYGFERRSGRPYATHPEEVAATLEAAFQRLPRDDRRHGELRRDKAIAYGHDTYEMRLDMWGRYLERPIVASPYTIEYLLNRKEYEFPGAAVVGRSVLLLCNNRGISSSPDEKGAKMEYLPSVSRGVALGGPAYARTKRADMHHNKDLDPDKAHRLVDPRDAQRRQSKYADGIQTIESLTSARESAAEMLLIASIGQVTLAEMRACVGRLRPIRLEPRDLNLAA